MTEDLELAAELVQSAGSLAARMLSDGVDSEQKTSVSDVVTAADRAAELLVTQRLRAVRPDDGLIGEEGAAQESASGRTWYIDPVDGTYNFLSGMPYWCSAVALIDERSDVEGPLIGAVYQPLTGELWLGGRGLPTTRNGQPLPMLDQTPMSQLSVSTYLHPATLGEDDLRLPLLSAISTAATMRVFGAGSLDLAAVAAGRVGASVQHDSLPWDWYPGAALVRGVGGDARVVEVGDHRWNVAGNARAVSDLATALGQSGS